MAEEITQQLSDLKLATLRKAQGKEIYNQLCNTHDADPNVVVPSKLSSGTLGGGLNVKTNAFNMKIGKESTVYLYRVEILGIRQASSGDTVRIDLNRIPKEDGFAVEHRYALFATIDEIFEKSLGDLPPRVACYYDSGNQLFSLEKIEKAKDGVVFTVGKEKVAEIWKHRTGMDRIDVQFVSTEQSFRLGQIIEEEPSGGYRCLQQCLDVMTTQQSYQSRNTHSVFQGGKSFMIEPTNFGYNERDCPGLKGGSYIAVGCQKSVKVVADTQGVHPVLVIEPKKAIFHSCQFVSEKMVSIFGQECLRQPWDDASIKRAEKIINKLVVVMAHLPGRTAQIKGISPKNATQVTFEYEGKEVTVADYYQLKYGKKLEFPRLPLLLSRGRQNTTIYIPMELCGIVDNQRQTQGALEKDQQEQLIKSCTVDPRFYEEHVFRNAKALNLLDDSYLKRADVEVIPHPIVVRARQLPAPVMRYNCGPKEVVPVKFGWAAPRAYIKGGLMNKWGFYWTDTSQGVQKSDLQGVIDAFGRGCNKFGIRIQMPVDYDVVENINQDMEGIFETAKARNLEYLLFVTNSRNSKVHLDMKYFERKYMITTQNVTSKVFLDGFHNNKNVTAENIINKVNLKFGGLNYILESKYLNLDEELLISYGVSSTFSTVSGQASGKDIIFVGYAANDLANSQEFAGDYVFQEGSSDVDYNVINNIISSSLKRCQQNRGTTPKRVVVYRNGVSEGQREQLLGMEVPIIRKIIENFSREIKLVFMTCTKSHNFRFYNERIDGRNAMEQNLKPGTVVDNGICETVLPEFYLQSHVGRLGTAKVPKYTVYANDANLEMDKLQAMTYALTYGHQIVRQSISVPLPCSMATALADRARRNFIMHSTTAMGIGANATTDYLQHVNEALRYENTPLREKRFNA